MYYVFANDFEKYPGVRKYDIPDVWLRYSNYTAERIAEELPPMIFYARGENLPDHLTNTGGFLLFNDHLRKVVDPFAGDSMQYFNTLIKDKKTKEEISIYYLARILVKIDCINYEKSDIEYVEGDPNSISYIKSLVLNEDKIGNNPIFILKKLLLIIMREDLVNAIRKANCTGMKFIRFEEYSGG